VNQVCWAAQYEGRKPHVDRPALKQAIDAYFLTESESLRRGGEGPAVVSRICA
jgi:hypothetical protein